MSNYDHWDNFGKIFTPQGAAGGPPHHKAGVVKVQGSRNGGGGLKYYLFEKFRAYLLKNIKNSWYFDHFWCFLDTKVKILPIFNIILKEILKFWHIFARHICAHFCKKYGNFLKFKTRFWGRFIIFSPRNGADLFSICRIITPGKNYQIDVLGAFQQISPCKSVFLPNHYIFLMMIIKTHGGFGMEVLIKFI